MHIILIWHSIFCWTVWVAGVIKYVVRVIILHYLVTSHKYRNIRLCTYYLLHRVVYSTPGRQIYEHARTRTRPRAHTHTHTLAPKGFVMSGSTHELFCSYKSLQEQTFIQSY